MWFPSRRQRRRGKGLFIGGSFSKRRRFLLVAGGVGLGLLGMTYVSNVLRMKVVMALGLGSYLASAWSLREELKGGEWLVTLMLPALYPVSVGFFYFLLPNLGVSKLIIFLLGFVGMYSILLAENIFAVARIKTIQLWRAARAVGFLWTILTISMLFNLIWAFRLSWYWNMLWVGVIGGALFLQGAWMSVLGENIKLKVWLVAGVGGVLMAEFAGVLSLLPMSVPLASVVLTILAYVYLGLAQNYLEERLFKKTVTEYVIFLVFAGVIVLISLWTYWVS